jgi:hypothetical protein
MRINRIMYIEDKSGGLVGPARIGRVTSSKRGKTLYYAGQSFYSLAGHDGLYGHRPTPIDDDVREEYWTVIRNLPERKNERVT